LKEAAPQGLPDEIPYRRLIKGSSSWGEDSNRLIELLEKYKAEYHVRNIELTV
jgi:hypothetical protein